LWDALVASPRQKQPWLHVKLGEPT
jgi:hypothetical protein